MVEKLVIDASIIVKWFIEEKDSEHALLIHDHFVKGELELHVPNLVSYEVLNALLYSKLFSNKELNDATTALLNYELKSHALHSQLALQTTRIAIDSQTTIYDSAYIALAQSIDCKVYTADIKLVNKIKATIKDVEILSLQDFEMT